jgi:hypothetical protein
MRVQCTCLQCGKPFSVIGSAYRAGRGKFCGAACKGIAQRRPRTFTCQACGIAFHRSPAHINLGATKYCSMVCRRAGGYGASDFTDRFWSYVAKDETPDGCWEWTGSRHGSGYGTLPFGSRMDGSRSMVLAHRASWLVNVGAIADGLFVCHRCDNPPCVRPDHLFLGTPQQNTNDMRAKGRSALGERHPAAVLTEADVRSIRVRAAAGVSRNMLAAEYGILPASIGQIVTRKRWKHVE